jgi:SAM-dependent methyltransferase
LFALPYLETGPLAQQWSVHAASYEAFTRSVLAPAARRLLRAVDLLDLGAGNCWLSWRLARMGHHALALDIRDDDIDGLGAAAPYLEEARFARIAASFEALPVADHLFDVVVFNASLHYTADLASTLREAQRVLRPRGRIAIEDSPFYENEADGDAMVAEKRRDAARTFGDRAGALMAIRSIEFLTADRLTSAAPTVTWRRHAVQFPAWYESRTIVARSEGRRAPSRFELWEGIA